MNMTAHELRMAIFNSQTYYRTTVGEVLQVGVGNGHIAIMKIFVDFGSRH